MSAVVDAPAEAEEQDVSDAAFVADAERVPAQAAWAWANRAIAAGIAATVVDTVLVVLADTAVVALDAGLAVDVYLLV